MPLESSDHPAAPAVIHRLDPDALANRLAEFGVGVTTEPAGSRSKTCVLRVDADRSLALLTRLRDDESFSMRRLVDLTAIDGLGLQPAPEARFTISYQLHSPATHQRLRVEVPIGAEAPTIESVSKLWPAARWLECEVFDLFGIRFRGHPELRRILLDHEFEGAPLRKDHPLKLERPIATPPPSPASSPVRAASAAHHLAPAHAVPAESERAEGEREPS